MFTWYYCLKWNDFTKVGRVRLSDISRAIVADTLNNFNFFVSRAYFPNKEATNYNLKTTNYNLSPG